MQAYDMLDEKQTSNKVDFSTMKGPATLNISKFTNVFDN